MISIIFYLTLILSSQVYGQQSASATIEKLCPSTSSINSPFCELYRSCSSSPSLKASAPYCQQANFNVLLAKMCANEFSKSPDCDAIRASCTSNPASCSTNDPVINAIPTAKNASDNIYLICQDMPMMDDCKTCPPPTMSPTGISNCALLSTYSKLCLDMPGMNGCKRFSDFCAVSPSSTFCGSNPSAPTTTEVSTSKYCADNNAFCVSIVYKSSTETCFQIATTFDGWVSFYHL